MKKILFFVAAMLGAFAVNAEPVVLPDTLDVTNVSFRSENMPDFVLAEGDYAGTYFDMGAHDSANDTLLYAEWDVTIEPLLYDIAVVVYNTNSWRVQLHLLNQAGDTVKDLRYKGSSGQCGKYAIGSIDMRDLPAGNYKLRARAATAWSAMKLKELIFTADYKGASVALPGTLLPAYAELSANASVTDGAIAFKPSTANEEYATWNVSFAAAGSYNVSIDFTASNGHTYGVALLSADGTSEIGAVAEAQSWDTGVKELGAIAVPAAGSYKVKLTNATQWSEAVLNSITFAAPAEPLTLYLKLSADWAGWPARYAIYTWKVGVGDLWVPMTLVENETDIYTASIPADNDKLVFVRLNGETTGYNWDEKWSQTVDLDMPAENTDLFTVTGGGTGSECTGTWSKYGEVIPEVKFKIAGSMTEWAPSIESYADTYTFENLAAGKYQMKVVDGDAWKGIDAMTEVAGGLFKDQDGNICFILAEAGNVTVTYTAEAYTMAGNFAAPEVKLIGIKGEGEAAWDASVNAVALTPAEDKLTASVTLNLTGWYYEFKLIIAGDWLGKVNEDGLYNLKSDWPSVDGLTREGANIKLTMGEGDKVPGDYTFTWNYAEGKLTVTFPTGSTSALDNADAVVKAVKVMENGQMYIIKNGVKYNAIGTMIK